jgi:hypothetical protein
LRLTHPEAQEAFCGSAGKKAYPLSKVYPMLEPCPAVLGTTPGNGRSNVMTLCWHVRAESEPPPVAAHWPLAAIRLR